MERRRTSRVHADEKLCSLRSLSFSPVSRSSVVRRINEIGPRAVLGLQLVWIAFCFGCAGEPEQLVDVEAISLSATNSELEFQALLDVVDQGPQVIALGEQSHGAGSVLALKSRIVPFLLEAGFRVFALEGSMYECHRANTAWLNGRSARESLALCMPPVWFESAQVQPLFEALDSLRSSGVVVEFAGVDDQFHAGSAPRFLTQELASALAGVDAGVTGCATEDLSQKYYVIQQVVSGLAFRTWEKGDTPLPADPFRHQFKSAVLKLRDCISAPGLLDDTEIGFWHRVLESLEDHAHRTWSELEVGKLLPREATMAKNMIWLANSRPGVRVVFWAANAHIAKSHVMAETGSIAMGGEVSSALGSRYFSIGTTSYRGRYGWPQGGGGRIRPARAGSLEYALAQRPEQTLFASALPPEAMEASFFGHKPRREAWNRFFDAVIFVREVEPSERFTEEMGPQGHESAAQQGG